MTTNENQNRGQDRLPIKVILPKQGKERAVSGGGGRQTPFRPVDRDYRSRLSNQVSAIESALRPQMMLTNSAPVRVKVITRASAKSHRPDSLFSQQSCPIIGAGSLGELFIKATPNGLKRLNEIIRENNSKRIIKEISCIEAIELITPVYRRRGLASNDILRCSPRGEFGFITKVRLFNYGADQDQDILVKNFEESCINYEINIRQNGYSSKSWIYAAECRSTDDVEALSKIIGVRSISNMPRIRAIKPKMLNLNTIPQLQSRGDIEGDIPVVVVVDSGIDSSITEFNGWIVGHDSQVAPEYQNTEHGTFVGGLICFGPDLNPTIGGIDSTPCGVFDLQVIPNDDPDKGNISSLLETELLTSLDLALQEHANKYKVWNLSLGSDEICSLYEFSSFAEELDNLQEKYQVSFVISAGNYITPPLLKYPRTGKELDLGRITSPADSVLGITVGAISHVDYKNKGGPPQNHPSAFSRHGAGPNHIIKPDLVHFGGACSIDSWHISGIKSLGGKGLVEGCGTSYSTPLVSRSLAQIYHTITPTPSPVLARALLTHHARDPRSGGRVPDGEENFFGFGLPSRVSECLECSPHTSTLIFEDVLRPGFTLEWDNFPYPQSLKKKDRYFGEIWMTVAFAPARGSRWGTEYCETHIEAHFGVYHDSVSRKTGNIKQVFKGLVPPEHKNPGMLYEEYQVEKLRKWAPVRTYYGNLGKEGERGNRWRLMLRLLTRHGIEDDDAFKPQPFALIVTISDPDHCADVYNEMAQIIRNRFQSQNLTVRSSTRIRTRR